MRGATPVQHHFGDYHTISTHTPHAGRDAHGMRNALAVVRFLLTRPMRGATLPSLNEYTRACHFYSHASYEARRVCKKRGRLLPKISTHTPLTRRDKASMFLARLGKISTHTPLTRRDDQSLARFKRQPFLLTRLLRGATRYFDKCMDELDDFYSHASYEARPFLAGIEDYSSWISTHTPLTRRDHCVARRTTCGSYFYSHASYEARPDPAGVRAPDPGNFYSHASYEARLTPL